jgi:hypothetical protein
MINNSTFLEMLFQKRIGACLLKLLETVINPYLHFVEEYFWYLLEYYKLNGNVITYFQH